jgi:hypothetical protein
LVSTVSEVSWSNYGPVIITPCSRTDVQRHPYRQFSVRYGQIGPFHGGNAGSNPAGDAKIFLPLSAATVNSDQFLDH